MANNYGYRGIPEDKLSGPRMPALVMDRPMSKIAFLTPVPPAPAATEAEAPNVLMLVPDQQGGIRSLFEQMQNAAGPSSARVHLEYFASNDDRSGVVARFPGRLSAFGRKLRDDGVDLCHINLSIKGSTLRKLFYAFVCLRAGVPYVLHLHGSGYNEFFARQPGAVKSVIRWLFGNALRVIALGTVWRDFVVEDVGLPAERVVVLANAVKGPASTIAPTPAEPARLLFLGRLGARKGVPELIEALASPAMRTLDWSATIAGDGDVTQFRERAAALGLGDRVSFPGWLDGSQAAALLAQSSILVLPSHAENLPLSMLEGMGYGLCPVVTPVGAVLDVIRDGENGLIVPVGDVQRLAEALARVVEDGDLRHRIGAQARADFLDCYDIVDYRGRLETIYRQALGKD